MSAIRDFYSGILFAIQLVINEKLYYYFIPALLLAVLFYLLTAGGASLGNLFVFMEDWWLIGWLLEKSKLFFSFLSFLFFEFVILVLLSPINSYFAERTKKNVTGEKINFSMRTFLRSLKRMIVILCFAFLMQVLLTILLWMLSFIFGDEFYELASIINISFFIGFSFFDFGLELDEVNRKNSWKYAKKNWLICILIGLLFNLGIYYPQKHGFLVLYLISIIVIPHILTIAASHIYFKNKPATNRVL